MAADPDVNHADPADIDLEIMAAAGGPPRLIGSWKVAGDIVILAALFDSAVPVVREYGETLADKIIVDITNPFNPSATGLAILTASPSPALPPRPLRMTLVVAGVLGGGLGGRTCRWVPG